MRNAYHNPIALPVAPRTGSDIAVFIRFCHSPISTHAPRTGSDAPPQLCPQTSSLFQPTLPARGATGRAIGLWYALRISTHAPRTGSDQKRVLCDYIGLTFQPTLPARGATKVPNQAGFTGGKFQPTLPARGATNRAAGNRTWQRNFNPRSPHGERRSRWTGSR